MPETDPNNTELRKYLLGSLSTEERQKVEELFMVDDNYFQELLVEETELIQNYAEDSLDVDERRNFEAHFLVSDERRERVKFAGALRRYVDEQEGEKKFANDTATIAAVPEKENYSPFFKRFFTPLRFALVGVLVAFSAFIIWNLLSYSSENKKVLAFLNQAHEKWRPLESRISGFDYAPPNNLRGGDSEAIDKRSLDRAKVISSDLIERAKTAENLHQLGRIYLAEKDFDRAIKQLEESRRADAQNAEILSDLAVSYFEKGRRSPPNEGIKIDYNGKALENLESALQINPSLPAAQFNKALYLQEMGLVEESKKAWRRYLELDSNSKWSDEARDKLGELETSKPQSKTREEILQKFLTSYRNRDDESAWEITNRNREMINGKLIPQQLAFLFLNALGKEKEEYLAALKYAGQLEKQKRKDPYFSEIADYYASASPEQQELLKEAQTVFLKGFKLSLAGENREAYRAFKNAQAMFTKAGDVWEAKLSEYWSAASQYNMSELSEHKRVLEELADFCEKREYKWFLAEIYTWLGVNAEEETEYSKALDYHKRAAKICEEISDVYNLQKNLTILADQYAKLKQFPSALSALEKSLILAAQFPESSVRQKWRNYDTAATVFHSLKNYAAAIAFEREALAIGEDTDNTTYKITANLTIGIIYGQQGKYREAIEILNQNRILAETSSDEDYKDKYLSAVHIYLANFKRLAGDCRNAFADYDKAIEYSSLKYKPDEYAAHKGRLLCHVAEGNETALEKEFPEVLNLFEQNRRKVVEEANRNTFFDNEQDVYDLAIDYEYRKGDFQKAFNYSETSRSRSLLDLLKYGAKLSDHEPEIKLPEVAEPLKLEEIRRSMPEQVQIVQYSVLNDKVLIWLVTKNDFSVFSSAIPAKELKEQVASYLEVLSGRTEESAAEERKLSKALYQTLIDPVAGKLDTAKEIAFVPDKFLFRVPFAALISPKTERFLVEDFVSFYSPSANVFLHGSQNARGKTVNNQETILAVGNPSFDQSSFPDLPALPDAKTEAEAVSGIYANSSPVVGKNATKETVKSRLAGAEIIHFAGHYVVDENSPMRSYLLLAGNREEATLSNYELMKGGFSPRTKLIVLSACETGIERYYNGEGMIGASRTLLGMGVPLVIASQWKVDSDATESLMFKFHRYRKQQNLASSIALRRAQLDMLGAAGGGQQKDYRKPFYWAAFAPIGGYTQF